MEIIPSVALGVHIEQTKCIYRDAVAKSRVYVLAKYYSFKIRIEQMIYMNIVTIKRFC